MAKAARKVKLSKRQIEAYRERDARAAAAWAVFSGGPSQAGLPFDDPHKQFMDRVRYDAIYSAYMADPPVASKDDGPEIRSG